MPRRILMIAFHFPPQAGSSGAHRTVAFSRYLRQDHGWEPVVLSAHERAYPATEPALLESIGEGVEVHRAFALDAARHLSIRGRYPRRIAVPDRWSTWWLGAVPAGRRLIRRFRPDVIWSTYPIATAHRIGLSLHRWSGLPWVADFRDQMVDTGYPRDPLQLRAHQRVEAGVMDHAARVVFAAPGAERMYRRRYAHLTPDRTAVIENGFEGQGFAQADRLPRQPSAERHVTLVHSGLLYSGPRDPSGFLAALGELKRNGTVSSRNLTVLFRASGELSHHKPLVHAESVEDLVRFVPAVSHTEALREMQDADGLLVFQGTSCNVQIPAKVYEYLRACRPIFALADPAGDTAALLRSAGVGTIAKIDSAPDISGALARFLDGIRAGTEPVLDVEQVEAYGRRARTAEFAQLLDDLLGSESSRAEP